MKIAFVGKLTSLLKGDILAKLKKAQPFIIVILMIFVILQLVLDEEKIVYKDNPIKQVISSAMTSRVKDDTIMTQEVKNALSSIREGILPSSGQLSTIDRSLIKSESVEEFIYLSLKLLRKYGSEAKQLQQSDVDLVISQKIAEEKGKIAAAQIATALKFDSNGDKLVTIAELDEQAKKKVNSAFVRSIRLQNIEMVKALDINSDATISYEEMSHANFSSLDIKDEKISAAESLLKLDLSKDGIVTVGEVKKVAKALFAFADKNHDDILLQDEKKEFLQFLQKEAFSKFEVKEGQELHVVSVFKGHVRTKKSTETEEELPPSANITIDRPAKEVVLLLSSPNPLQWNILKSAQTKLVKIILNSGNKELTTVNVNKEPYDNLVDWGQGVMPYENSGIDFVQFKKDIKQKTAVETLSTFSGVYESKDEFIIDSVSRDSNLRFNNLAVDHEGKAPRLPLLMKINGVSAQYNARAEMQKSIPMLLEQNNVIYSDQKKNYFQVSDDGFKQYDKDGRLLEKVTLDKTLPQFSGHKSIAFNKLENTIAVVTSGANSHIYFYDFEKKKWTAFDVKEEDFSDISYNQYKKQYQAIAIDKEGALSITSFDESGAETGVQKFDTRLYSGLSDLYNPNQSNPMLKIFSGRDYLIIAAGKDASIGKGNVERIYLYNESIDRVNLVWFKKR